MVANNDAWSTWTRSGILIIEQYIMELIARSYKNKASPDDTIFSNPAPLYEQEVGVAALKSVEYKSIE